MGLGVKCELPGVTRMDEDDEESPLYATKESAVTHEPMPVIRPAQLVQGPAQIVQAPCTKGCDRSGNSGRTNCAQYVLYAKSADNRRRTFGKKGVNLLWRNSNCMNS